MRNWKSLPALIGAAVLLAVVLYVAFYFVFLDLFVDLWWFESLNFESYFWLRLLYRFILSGVVTLVFFSIFFFHFWIASRYLGLNPPDEVLADMDKRRRFQRFADVFMSGSVKFYTPIALLLAIFVALPFYDQWESTLLYFFGGSAGVSDTIYGNDVSFYMLSYPTYQLVQKELLWSAAIIFCMVGILYWLEHVFVPDQSAEFPTGAKLHLTLLIGFVVAFVVWGYLLDRFALLYTNFHEPIFYGPGFIEIRYKLPLIWLAIGSFIALAVTAVLFIFSEKHRIKAPFLIALGLFSGVSVLPSVQLIPDLIQKFIVNPNPVKTEHLFMQHNIDATLNGYDLKNINVVEMKVKLDAAQDIETWGTQKRFENIPVWDKEFILDSFKQLQEIRPYYNFLSVHEDRYYIRDHLRQVNLAAREINTSSLPKEAQNWENVHLRYTHGYGAAVTPAAQDADKPLIWYLRDLEMNSDVGLKVKHPDIYYGLEQYDYAIVPNNLTIMGIAGTDHGLQEAFHGVGGVPIPSYFRKALFSFYFKDEKIFFSSNVTSESKVKLHRNIVERVNKLTPFLHQDKEPYLVMTEDRYYWVIDAYTLSDKYPASIPASEDFLDGEQKFNYIRNSVKVVIDALDGDVDYYISDPTDAIIQAYSSAYPGLFKSLDEMPKDLRAHLRYPQDLYFLQMKVYAKYHQQSPELFYEQAETWQFAQVRDKTVLPYYQTMDFGNCDDQEEFVLINPMTPINRSNLSMIGIASTLDHTNCGLAYKPSITVYKFGKDVQVNGPAQIEALTQQSPDISEQFTLWDQKGSKVEMGRMVILPMGNTVLYVQPIYIASTKNKMPQLTRVIVSIGNETIMDTTLSSAFKRLKDIFIKNSNELNGTETLPLVNKPAVN